MPGGIGDGGDTAFGIVGIGGAAGERVGPGNHTTFGIALEMDGGAVAVADACEASERVGGIEDVQSSSGLNRFGHAFGIVGEALGRAGGCHVGHASVEIVGIGVKQAVGVEAGGEVASVVEGGGGSSPGAIHGAGDAIHQVALVGDGVAQRVRDGHEASVGIVGDGIGLV